jgi:recombinational DNA repair protein RecT
MNKSTNALEALRPTEPSIMALIMQYKTKMIQRASDSIRKATPAKQDQFLARTIASIVKNENLKECFNSIEGKMSIYTLIDDCLKTGLELDKHAYAIPYSKKTNNGYVKTASFQIKRQGFHALLCGGSKPIFKDLKWGMVYENEKDDVNINRATGEISHPISIDSDRGKPIGCWVQAIKFDGTKEAEFYPISFIYNIRNNHSKTYQDYLAKKIHSCTWITDEIPMIEKTAIKAFCRPYAEVHEELGRAYYSEGDEIIEQKQNIVDKANDIIEDATFRLEQENNNESEIIEEKEPVKEEKKSLF